MVVSVLLQISHSLVHRELDVIQETISSFPELPLVQYIEKALREKSQEDQLCACLTLVEHLHLLSQIITPAVNEQLLVWLQTYISGRIRQQMMSQSSRPAKDSA